MKSLLKLIFSGFHYLMSIIAALLFLSLVGFYVLWLTGVVEQKWPLLYCAMSKSPSDKTVKTSDSTLIIIHYNSGCNCDTTYYQKIQSYATVQRP